MHAPRIFFTIAYMSEMTMFRLIAAFAAAMCLVGPSWAEKASLQEVSAYLNSLTTVEASFTQISEDGSVQTGKLFIQRPGKMRFEYAPPQKALVLASNNAVAIFDDRSNGHAETYPLRRTPLSLILAKNVNLSAAKMVVGHSFDGTHTIVTAQDPNNPSSGQIQMKFSDAPLALTEWVLRDEYGAQTLVRLDQVSQGMSFPRALFDIDRERAARRN